MKKLVIPLCLGIICIAGISTDLLAESGKKAYIGLDVGICPILNSVDGYRFGGEIGYHVSKRIGIIADIGYERPVYNFGYEKPPTILDLNNKYSGLAPHIRISIEADLLKRFAVYAGIKGIVGSANKEKVEDYEK